MSVQRTPVGKRSRQDSQEKTASHLSDLLDTPRRSTRVADLLEERLLKFSETIMQSICASEARIVAEVNNSVDKLKNECAVLSARVQVVEASSKEVFVLKDDVAALASRVNRLENLAVSNELRIRGVPLAEHENLIELFHKLCSTVDIHAPVVQCAQRLNGGASSGAPDIIVKLGSHVERNNILRAVAVHKKKLKAKNLSLRHLGVEGNGDHHFYINENMAKSTYNIFKSALSLKKDKRLSAVYCLRGRVHVRKNDGEEAVCIDDALKLAALEEELGETGNDNQNNKSSMKSFRK